ncbi:MarC family protein [Saccharicrinis aurantiacus]|uniref:MarC family protein n=1 Tax=Saccharicrinis aurantiacus TaxID=1849719 RepID=UPI00094F572B|nr:MarC family protein [Saccharicrinis aurantiacus]
MIDTLLTSFITFFTVIDPIGTIPVFIAVTASVNNNDKKKIAIKAAATAAGVLLFFIVLGEIIINAIDIPLPTFQIAGGIVLFLFALTMIFGESKPEEELSHLDKKEDKAIFPLAMPSLASPGAILAAILLTENSKYSIVDQSLTALMMLAVIFIALIFMLLSAKIFKYIGNSGAAIISRVMGLILSSVAVANVLQGIKIYFDL